MHALSLCVSLCLSVCLSLSLVVLVTAFICACEVCVDVQFCVCVCVCVSACVPACVRVFKSNTKCRHGWMLGLCVGGGGGCGIDPKSVGMGAYGVEGGGGYCKCWMRIYRYQCWCLE